MHSAHDVEFAVASRRSRSLCVCLSVRVWPLCRVCCLSAVCCVAGIIGGISDAMVKDRFFPDSTSGRQSIMSGILTASLLLGAFAGCFLGVDAGNRWGHRVAFRITGAICTVMSIALALMPTFELIVIARMLLGVSVGFTSALAPWYGTHCSMRQTHSLARAITRAAHSG